MCPYCTLETHKTLYVSYTGILKKEKGMYQPKREKERKKQIILD